MTVAFTEEETAWHKTAQFGWAPFVARLLSYGPFRGKSEELPHDVRALNSESIDAVKEIMNRAVWRFLARECGWRQRRICEGPDLQLKDARLWNQQTPELRFTHESIELLLSIYNATRGTNKIEKAKIRGCLEANGDVILHHLIFRRLYYYPKLANISENYRWNQWTKQNPLNAICDFAEIESAEDIKWERILEPDLINYSPWIITYSTQCWQRTQLRDWGASHSKLKRGFENLKTILEKYIDSSIQIGRYDLTVPIISAFKQFLKEPNVDLMCFQDITKRLSMNERRKTGKSWSDFLDLTDKLEMIQQNALDLHPVERGGPEKLYLSAWEELDFSAVLTTAKELQQKLTPRLS